jgi:hypothetical protein
MSRNKYFRKVTSGDRNISQLQSNVEQAVSDVIKAPILNGRLLEDVELTSAPTRIEHKLGRKPSGYIIVKRNADAQVYDSLASEESPALFLPLISSANVTVSIWIF